LVELITLPFVNRKSLNRFFRFIRLNAAVGASATHGFLKDRLMPVVICEECRQSVTVAITDSGAKYQFDLVRCTQKTRPSTQAERLVDATWCPRLEATIRAAFERSKI
jgi:hypothetical protein